MPNPKKYYYKDKEYEGIELTPGEQLYLAKLNNKLIKEQVNETIKDKTNCPDAGHDGKCH